MVSASKNFTDRERELLSMCFQNLKTPPEVDYEKMAEMAGFKNAKSCRDCLRPILKKVMTGPSGDSSPGDNGNGNGDDEEGTPKPKATPRKRKNAADGGADGSPPKKGTPRKGKKAAADATEAETADDDDEEAIPAIKPEVKDNEDGDDF